MKLGKAYRRILADCERQVEIQSVKEVIEARIRLAQIGVKPLPSYHPCVSR